MCVWHIFGARLVKSLWDFHRWIPGEKSHRMDYSLSLFGAVCSEVIFHGGVLRHVDPAWHAYVTLGHTVLASLAWHVGHVISSSTWSIYSFDSQSFICYICSLTPRGFHTMYYEILCFDDIFVHWHYIISLGKGTLAMLAPFTPS